MFAHVWHARSGAVVVMHESRCGQELRAPVAHLPFIVDSKGALKAFCACGSGRMRYRARSGTPDPSWHWPESPPL